MKATFFAVTVILFGCNNAGAPRYAVAPSVTPPGVVAPPSPGAVQIDGLVTCQYTSGVLSGCALNPGATLDAFANSVLAGVTLTGAQ